MGRIIVETVAQITAPDDRHEHRKAFSAGIVLWDDKVIEAAPIIRFMKRWTRAQVRAHCERKGWKIEVVTEAKRSIE